MRNLNIYLVLFLCLFVSKIAAQDQSLTNGQAKKTYEEAEKEYTIKAEQIKQEEEKKFNEAVDKLKIQRKKGDVTRQEFKDKQFSIAKANEFQYQRKKIFELG